MFQLKKSIRIIKAQLLLVPRTERHSELRYTRLVLSGRWLEALGFKADRYFYIKEQDGCLVISPTPFLDNVANVTEEFSTLDQLKAKFKELDIPVTREKGA